MRAEIRVGERAREEDGCVRVRARRALAVARLDEDSARVATPTDSARGGEVFGEDGGEEGGGEEEHALVVERADVLDAGEALDRGGRLAGGGTSDAARGVHEEHARRDTRGGVHVVAKVARREDGLGRPRARHADAETERRRVESSRVVDHRAPAREQERDDERRATRRARPRTHARRGESREARMTRDASSSRR